MLSQLDIEDLVQRCRSSNARAYIKEAVDCYRIGAYRACVITTWIALVYDFIDKLRELALSGDAAATRKVNDFDDIQRNRDTEAALKFERNVLTMVKDEFELITVQEFADLSRLFEDRNRCGHPNLNRDNDVYSPPPELARLHLRTCIEHVLERPPVQGKSALQMLQQTVDSEYFPTTVHDAEPVLQATPLRRAKRNLVRDFVMGALTSITREALTKKKALQRVAAVAVAQRFHPDIVIPLLKEKFDGIAFKTPDDGIRRILWLLSIQPDLTSFLTDATWPKLENYTVSIPSDEFGAINHALQVARLHPFAERRLKKASLVELSLAVARLTSRPDDALLNCCIEQYSDSGSFNHSKVVAKELIIPLLGHMNEQQAKRVIAAGKNSQVRETHIFLTVVSGIKDTGILSMEALSATIEEHQLKRKLGYLVTDEPGDADNV